MDQRHAFSGIVFRCIAVVTAVSPFRAAAEEENGLSLADLFKLEAPSLIVDAKKEIPFDINPSATTVITARDIELTPARDIYDLIEIYVPGAIWMAHNEGAHPGIRGIINDRNYKYLLVVNGVVMNEKFANGMTSELENWDLSDIKRIEIIRGPGSVTFGPGAVGGVINIVTKDPAAVAQAGSRAAMTYRSYGFSYTSGMLRERCKVFMNASVASTEGLRAPRAFTVSSKGEAGYIGDPNYFKLNPKLQKFGPENFYQDYRMRPQIKATLDVRFLEHGRFWMRYTGMGDAGLHGYSQEITQDQLIVNGFENDTINGGMGIIDTMAVSNFKGKPQNIRGRTIRQATSNAENKFALNDMVSLDLKLNALSTDVEIVKHQKSISLDYSVFDRYSENTGCFHALLNIAFGNNQIAVGGEASRTQWERGWGNPEPYLADVVQKPKNPVNIPLGWRLYTVSLLGEGLFRLLTPRVYGLFSMRIDNVFRGMFEYRLASTLYSPRVAIVGDAGNYGTLKLICQQSNRAPTAADMYRSQMTGNVPDAELLRGGELIYRNTIRETIHLESNVFGNNVQTIGWGSDKTILIGEQNIAGVEISARYAKGPLAIGVGQTYTKQLSMNCYDENFSSLNKIRSGLSYADYHYLADDYKKDSIMLVSEGNDISNWPNLSTKVYANYEPLRRLTLHADARCLYQWAGELSGITMLEKAAQGGKAEADTALQRLFRNVIDTLRAHDAYETDFRLNLLAEYRVNGMLTIRAYVQNALGLNGNKRYNYSSGHQYLFSNKINWHEEPRAYGAWIAVNF